MRWTNLLLAAVALMVSTAPAPADAAIVQRAIPVSEMASTADGIFVGQVVSRLGSRASTRGEIVTEVTLRIDSALKGHAGGDGRIRVILPGGEVGGDVEVVRGAASFSPGEQVLIFVSRNNAGSFQVLGMAQGKYSLREEQGQVWAVHDPSDVLVLNDDPTTGSRSATALPAQQVPLASLLEEVRQVIEPSLVMR